MRRLMTLHAPMRILGIQAHCRLADMHALREQLWARWQRDKAESLPSFTQTVYCVYQYHDDDPDKVVMTIGRLVSQELPQPDFAWETILPAQDYQCYDVPDLAERLAIWQEIEQDNDFKRSFISDFETYSANGLPKIYVGVAA